MAICTAPRASIAPPPPHRAEKSAIRFDTTASAAVAHDRLRRRGWAGPTMA